MFGAISSRKSSLSVTALLAFGLIVTTSEAATHTVQAGDSLWVLAKRYGVSVESIQAANSMGTSEVIRTGQKLTIPTTKSSSNRSKSDKATDKEPTETTKPPPAKKSTSSSAPAQAAKTKPSTQSKGKPVTRKEDASSASSDPSKSKPSTSKPQLTVASSVSKPEPAKPSALQRIPTRTSRSPSKPLPQLTRAHRDEAEQLYASASTRPPNTLEEAAPAWVLAKPDPSTQVEKSNAARGGVFPCAAPDSGFGAYSKWHQVAPMAHLLAPKQMQLPETGDFDVLFHFHGREPLRKEWVQVMDNEVLVAIDVGIDSHSYAQTFQDPRTFGQVLRAVEAEIKERFANPNAHIRHLAVSSWSAGYGALSEILAQPHPQTTIDAVIILDGLHSGYTAHSLEEQHLRPFLQLAQRAAQRDAFFFLSHSSITTRGYASTTETANYLAWKIGGRPQPTIPRSSDPMGLERIATYTQGDFHIRGFRGIGAADHCAHLGLLRDILRVHIKPRWNPTPQPNDTPVALNAPSP